MLYVCSLCYRVFTLLYTPLCVLMLSICLLLQNRGLNKLTYDKLITFLFGIKTISFFFTHTLEMKRT